MARVARIRVFDSVSRERLADGWQRAASQPNPLLRVLTIAVLLIVVVPLLLVVGLVALGAAVFLACVALLKRSYDRLRRRVRGDGRANVRVIRRPGGHHGDA
jgi:hypothetical protein